MSGDDRRLSMSTKLYYGFGSAAYGIKDSGFNYFLLFFYSQVMGLPPSYVSFAIMVALVFDAMSDPVVGHVSDNWHAKWGRRHPFMYFAAVPVAVSYYFLWNPPLGLSAEALTAYLIVVAIFIRTMITLYEIPSTSLVPELTQNYDERTTLLSYRYFFGWMGGITMTGIAYGWLLQPNAEYAVGQLNRDGYNLYGLVAAGLMLTAILVSAIGTHRHIPNLRKPPPKKPFNLGETFGEIIDTLNNRSFLVLFGTAIFAAAAAGVTGNLNLYFTTYFWELSPNQMFWLTTSYAWAAVLALMFTPRISKVSGKKATCLMTFGAALVLAPVPYVLRYAGLFPENHSELLVPLLYLFNIIEISLIIAATTLVSAMVADVVEDSELRTGRRSEGLFFAVRTFAIKTVHGFGALAAALILAWAEFPANATPGQVPQVHLDALAFFYIPALLLLYGGAMAFIFAYRISRESHQQNLEQLAGE
jgi:glycoside/pentoside/hexuronide:cation symporter, GPH family